MNLTWTQSLGIKNICINVRLNILCVMMRWDVSSSFSLQTRRGFDLLPWESGNCMGLAGGSLVHLSFIIFGYLGTVGGAEIALDLEHLLTVPWHKTSNGSKSPHQRHHIRLLKISDHAVFISDNNLCLFVSNSRSQVSKWFKNFKCLTKALPKCWGDACAEMVRIWDCFFLLSPNMELEHF